jgi:spectinomycin phosphotransferase
MKKYGKKEHIIKHLVISSLKNSYGIDITDLTSLPLGADADALIYKAYSNNTSYFIKLKDGQHNISVTLQFLLHDAGIKEIICPIKTFDGQLTLYVSDFTLIVYPFIDGQDGFSKHLTDNQWIIFGKTLKRIHEFQLPASISELIKREAYSTTWRNKVKALYEYHQQVLAFDEITSKFLASLKTHKSIILRLVEQAEELLPIIQKQSAEFVLCHGDIHAGNVLIAKNKALYIVDWDQPIMAPKERDLMFIGAGIGNVWNTQREIELFYTGYGKTEINKTIIDYYRCERIIEDVASYNQELLSANGGYKDRLTSYNHFVAMFEQNGVVDIALQETI